MLNRRGLLLAAGAAVVAGGAIYATTRGPSYESVAHSVWTPPTAAGDPDLRYLIHHATLAANSHNTQPWLFSGSAKSVTIRPDLERATPVVDPDNHHLFASLGCAGENLLLAAAAAGTSGELQFVDAGDGHIEIALAAGDAKQDPLFAAIADRQCTRSNYDGRPVAKDDLKRLETAAQVDGCRVVLLSDTAKTEQALELILAANAEQVSDPAFASELLAWLRFNSVAAVRTRDGLYSGCSGNPTMPTWIGKMMFGFVFTPQAENDKYAEQIRSSSGLAVFVADRDDPAHWVQAGRSYQRFALQATALGIRHAFVNQPLEVARHRPQVANLAGVSGQRPNLIVRYGYAPPMPRSLRRPLDEIIV